MCPQLLADSVFTLVRVAIDVLSDYWSELASDLTTDLYVQRMTTIAHRCDSHGP